VPHDHGEWPQISDRLGEIFCLTFIRNSDDADALRRMGALSDTVGQRTLGDLTKEAQEFDHGYPTVAAAARLDGWTVMIEPGGFEGSDTALLSAVSEGSEAMSVLHHAYASNRFGYAAAGRLVTGFDPSWPGRRWGTHPDRLLSVMDEVGMTPDDPDAGYVEGTLPALELAGRITGVGVPLRVLDEPLLSAWIEPWFSDAVPPPVSNGDPLMHAVTAAPAQVRPAVIVAELRRLATLLRVADAPGLADTLAAAESGGAPVPAEGELGQQVRAWLADSRRAGTSLNDHSARHRMNDTERNHAFLRGWWVQALRAVRWPDSPTAAAVALRPLVSGPPALRDPHAQEAILAMLG